MGGSLTPFIFCANLLVRVKLGYPPNFKFLGKPLLGEKYVEGRKKKKKKKKKNNAKFSGHYVCPRTETVREHALCSHQKNNAKFSGHYVCPCTHTVHAHALRSHQNVERKKMMLVQNIYKKLLKIEKA